MYKVGIHFHWKQAHTGRLQTLQTGQAYLAWFRLLCKDETFKGIQSLAVITEGEGR